MSGARAGAAAGLRAGATALLSAAGLTANGEYTWVLRASGEALNGCAVILDRGDEWAEVRMSLKDALQNVLRELPEVRDRDARGVAEGVVSLVSVIRGWMS